MRTASGKNTVYTIAHELKMSPSTISRVLNHPEQVRPDTRMKVESYLQQTQFHKRKYYSVAAEESRKKSSVSALPQSVDVLFNFSEIRNSFYNDILSGAKSAADQHGYHIVVDLTQISVQNIDQYLPYIVSRFRGLVVSSALPESLLRKLASAIPLVQCSEYAPGLETIASVGIDDYSAEMNAVDYLISRGRKDIAFMTVDQPFHFARQRYLGYRFALSHAGLHVDPDNLIKAPKFVHSLAYDAAIRFFESGKRPDAIVCISDTFAAACIKAALHMGLRVPEDLSVVGFDNLDLASFYTPSITTVAQPRFQLGYYSAEALFRVLQDPSSPRERTLLPTELQVRESA